MLQLNLKKLGTRLAGPRGRFRIDPGTPATDAAPGQVTPEAVTWGYRLFLDREPESPEVVGEMVQSFHDVHDMRMRILGSPEYRMKNPPMHVPALTGEEPPLVIEEVEDPADMARIVAHIGHTWQFHGETEPHWSVITSDRYTASRIKDTESEFFNSGEEPVRRLFKTLERNAVDTSTLRTCAEYGCGLGRVTGWLARKFERVYAYDISAAHLEGARSQLAERGIDNVNLRHIRAVDDIRSLERVDVVYSLIVLQHNPPPVIRLIVREFLRALNPGGVAFFQVPTYRAGYGFSTQSYLDNEAQKHVMMEMHVLPQREIFEIARQEGGQILEVIEDGMTSLRYGEVSNTFLIRKPT